MRKSIRSIGMAIVSLVFRWPLWGVLFLSRPLLRWRSLFVVYPGQVSDVKAYAPDSLIWLRDTWLYRGKPQFAGIQFRKNAKDAEGHWGIVVYISSTADELHRDKHLVLNIMRRLHHLSRLLGIKAIACAGQIPSIIHKHNIQIEAPFVDGRLGSAFSVITTITKIYSENNFEKDQKLLVIVGIGFLGKMVLENIASSGFRARGIDIHTIDDGIQIGEDAVKTLSQSDVVVVLTPRGEDFIPYLKHLKPGAIIIDDTHPRLRHKIENNPVYKVALEWPGFKFLPELPGYKKKWIPGCMVEAIVKSHSNHPYSTYEDFHNRASRTGFEVLINPVKDL